MTQEIVLAMIVKNEEHVIARCLDSVLPHVNRAIVNDNGSTDRTPTILAERQVETLHSPWWDFSTNRNLVMKQAREHGDYILCGLDADEVFVPDNGWTWPALDKDAYWIECRYGNLRYKRLALVRADKPFVWRGVIHEALVCDESYTQATLPGVHIEVHSDGARAREPGTTERDLVTLQQAVKNEPANSRYQFYLAQTLKDLGRYVEARDAYRKRVAMGGWPEETAYAEYMVGKMSSILNDEDPTQALLNAYSWNPARAEPLVELARSYRFAGNYALAVVYAEAAAQLSVPPNALFVEQDVYEWRALDEVVIAAYYVPFMRHRGERAAAILSLRAIPPSDSERVRESCAFYTRM